MLNNADPSVGLEIGGNETGFGCLVGRSLNWLRRILPNDPKPVLQKVTPSGIVMEQLGLKRTKIYPPLNPEREGWRQSANNQLSIAPAINRDVQMADCPRN